MFLLGKLGEFYQNNFMVKFGEIGEMAKFCLNGKILEKTKNSIKKILISRPPLILILSVHRINNIIRIKNDYIFRNN